MILYSLSFDPEAHSFVQTFLFFYDVLDRGCIHKTACGGNQNNQHNHLVMELPALRVFTNLLHMNNGPSPLIDLRPETEFVIKHVLNSTSIPSKELEDRTYELPPKVS